MGREPDGVSGGVQHVVATEALFWSSRVTPFGKSDNLAGRHCSQRRRALEERAIALRL